jgi:ArsR family transcriptional regulator
MNGVFLENPDLADRAALIAQALAHPVRLQILEIIGEQGAYFMHIASLLARPQANLSQHLSLLREAGLVDAQRLTVPGVLPLLEALRTVAERGAPQLDLPERWGRHRGRREGLCRCPRCQG